MFTTMLLFFLYIYFTSFFCSISLFFWRYLADKFLDIFIYMKKGYKKIIRNRYTRRFKNSTFNYNFVIIYITHKLLELLKNHLNFMKDSITKCFFKGYNRRSFSFLFIYLFIFASREEKLITKDMRSLFKLKKELNILQLKI